MKRSKESNLLELFFNEPTKHWHFEEAIKVASISRKQAVRWLKLFQKERLINRIKERKKMPYYVSNYASPEYQNKKRIFALDKLYNSGFLNHLMNLPKAITVILFGSMVRGDWHKHSDIDLFIYGKPDGLRAGKYELLLNRDIQVFECLDMQNLRKFPEGLLRNILRGDIIKGNLGFVRVQVNA